MKNVAVSDIFLSATFVILRTTNNNLKYNMEIKVLGTGCAGCKALEATVREVVAEMSIEATVEKVEDIMEIMSYNVMRTPAIVVDGKVVSSGKKLSASEVKTILTK